MTADHLTVGSLCTGYGGLDLALKAHFQTRVIWTSEIDKHASRVVKARYRAPNLGDLKLIDWEAIPAPDIITAGYPCQPFSHAGSRRGTQDPRHIWPWIAEGVRALRPRLIFLENVAAHLTQGFGEVIGTLAEMGYDATWGCVRASDAGAPHRRERVFIVATDADGGRLSQLSPVDRAEPALRLRHPQRRGQEGIVGPVPGGDRALGENRRLSPATLLRCRLSPKFAEWMMGLPAGWVTGVGLGKTQQLKILGNGVVPQQAALALTHLLPLALTPSRQRSR